MATVFKVGQNVKLVKRGEPGVVVEVLQHEDQPPRYLVKHTPAFEGFERVWYHGEHLTAQ